MAKKFLSTREVVSLLFLVVLLIGVGYYLFFYQPLQNDLAAIANQSRELDSAIEIAAVKVGSMNGMQEELDDILSRPKSEITEIAPYDNAKVVMSQLNGILSASEEYNLSFNDVDTDNSTGMVRRTVSMEFRCASYESAKSIIEALSASQWRCQITNVVISTNGQGTRTELALDEDGKDIEVEVYDGIMTSPVSVKASIVFFESTAIQ